MAVRTKRIETRADPESEAKIARAGKVRRVSMSAFVLDAAGREADRVPGQADQTIMPAADFDALIASLDVSDAAPRLSKAARRSRSFERR